MDSKGKLILKNTTMLYVRMALLMLVGLYTSRVILDALGISDYGVYNVVGGLSTMFMFLNSSMAVSTSRFLTYELGRNQNSKLTIVYQQSVIIHIAIAICVFILIETIGNWFLYNKLVIPDGRLGAAAWTLHTVAVVSVLNILSTPDLSLIIAYEKMTAFAYISLFDVFFKLFLAFSLTLWSGDRLILYSIMLMAAQLIVRILYFIYSKINFPVSRGKIIISYKKFKEMLSFASWNLLGNLALMSIDQGINVLLNIFCGPIINAARGISSQITNYINNFMMNIRMAINPQITKSYSSGDLIYMHSLIRYSSLSCFYLLLAISIPMFWLIDIILDFWLVDVPIYTGVFLRLSLVYLITNSLANPIIIGVHSTGKIVRFQVVEGILMLMALPLAWLFLHYGLPPYWVYISQIIIAIISQIGRLYVTLPTISMKLSYYVIQIICPCLVVSIISSLVPLSLYYTYITYNTDMTFVSSITMAFISFIWTMVVLYILGLRKKDRRLVIHAVCKLIKK